MKLRWTEQGVADLEHITDYLFEHAPLRAERTVRKLYDAAGDLLTSPWIGRPGKKEGTRELVLSPLPYIVVYRVTGDVIHVVRILHGAQKWP
jgi:toxin ParE1/3/4